MKKLFKIAMIAIAAMASFSCAKEITPEIEGETEEVVVKEGFKLHAEVDSELTKTVLSGTSILWGETDAVKAFGDNVYTSTSIERTNGNKTAEFTFGPLEDGDDVLFALYPAINAGGTDYDNMTITIPSEQVATADSFDPAAMAAIGEIDGDYKIAFKNIGALLSIVINNDDIASVELSATEESGDSMTGTAAVEMDGAGNITTVTDGLSTRVKLIGGLNNGETYYFVIYPGTYSNLRIVVTDTDGAIAVYRNKTQFTVERNENWKIAELTIPDGKWIAATVETNFFYESFDAYNGTGANDGLWSGSIANTSWNAAFSDNAGWISMGNVRMANKCVRIGGGSITTPHLGITEASVGLSFKAAAWDEAEEMTTMRVTVKDQGKIKIGETEYTDYDFSIVKGSWSTLSAKVIGANTDTRLTFESQGSRNRFFLDEVKLFTVTARDDTPIHYTVTYDANTGAGEVPSDATDYNDQTNFIVTVADRGELTKTGHSFNGWNTAADGSGTAYMEGDTFVINNNITLYAQWTPIVYAITKNVNAHCNYTVKAGGVEVSTATYGTSLSLEADTPDAGYFL